MLTIKMLILLFKPLIFVMLIGWLVFALRLVFINFRFQKSHYDVVSGNNFFKTVFNKGNYGEFLTFCFLEKLQGDHKLLTNIYIPKDDGTTTEIDLLMISKSGIYVFESKNYSGWIFGDEKNKNWTQSLKGAKKNKFFNPVWQNKGHINALEKLFSRLDKHVFYSYIVFSERCELKKVSVTSQNVYVLKRNELLSALNKDINKRAMIFTDEDITNIYTTLQKYTLANEEIKQQHIESINSRLEN